MTERFLSVDLDNENPKEAVEVTSAQLEIYIFMSNYLKEHYNVPPAISEISQSVSGVNSGESMSKSVVSYNIKNMVEKGLLVKAVEGNAARSITLNPDFDTSKVRFKQD